MDTGQSVDHPGSETVQLHQGTGPRATVSVLFISMILAVAAGAIVLSYFALR